MIRVMAALSLIAVLAWTRPLLATPCAPGPGVAEPTAEARAANDLAVELAHREQFVEALALFRKAYELSPSYVILFNIGRMAEKTGDAALAIRSYRCHVEEGGEDVGPERKAEVLAAVARLRQAVAVLSVVADEPGLEVFVDGTSVGVTPVGEVFLNPGRVRVRVMRDPPEEREVSLAAGDSVRVEFERGSAPTPPQTAPFRFPEALVGSAWVITGIVAVTGAVTGALSLVAAGEVADEVYLGPARRPSPDSAIAQKADTAESLAVATDALIVAGAISLSSAITFSVVNALSGGGSEKGGPAGPARGATVSVAPMGAGLALVGSFP